MQRFYGRIMINRQFSFGKEVQIDYWNRGREKNKRVYRMTHCNGNFSIRYISAAIKGTTCIQLSEYSGSFVIPSRIFFRMQNVNKFL